MQTLQQKRARFALKKVKEIAIADREEFKRQAENFPAMIRMNGLGQAAAFYYGKGGAHKRLYDVLSDWLKQSGQPYHGQDLLDGITRQNMHAYRLAQSEALLLLDWVKKFAKAFAGDNSETGESEPQP